MIGLAPGRINRGDEPSHYLLRVNLHGKTMSHEMIHTIQRRYRELGDTDPEALTFSTR